MSRGEVPTHKRAKRVHHARELCLFVLAVTDSAQGCVMNFF